MGSSPCQNWQSVPISNPKPNLYNINTHTKFGENPLTGGRTIDEQTDGRTDERTHGRTHGRPTWNHNSQPLSCDRVWIWIHLGVHNLTLHGQSGKEYYKHVVLQVSSRSNNKQGPCNVHRFPVIIIGIKHGFHALTFARSRGRCWKPRPEAAVFNTSQGTWRMLMHWKTMFDRYYCINL